MADLAAYSDDELDAIMAEGTDDEALVTEYMNRRLRRSLLEHTRRLLAAVEDGDLVEAASLATLIEHAITDRRSGVAEAFGYRHEGADGGRRLVKEESTG